MDIERLKELTQSEDSDLWDYKEELIALIDDAIACQSVATEEVPNNMQDSVQKAIVILTEWRDFLSGTLPADAEGTREIMSYNLAITALQAYQSWIPCTERMPTEDDADEDGFVLTLDADRQQTDYQHSEIEAWNNRCDVKITHWRPMLPIPKGE